MTLWKSFGRHVDVMDLTASSIASIGNTHAAKSFAWPGKSVLAAVLRTLLL